MRPKKLRSWWKGSFKKILSAIFLLIFFSGVVIFAKSDFWRIKKIDCRLDGAACPSEIQYSLMSLLIGKNFFSVSARRLVSQILSQYSYLKSAAMGKRLPDRLYFELKKREPAMAVASELLLPVSSEATDAARPEFIIDNNFYLTDEEGIVLEKATTTDLPVILIQENPKIEIGQAFADETLKKAIKAVIDFRLNLWEPKTARLVSDRYLEVWLKDNLEVLFSLQKEAQLQLDSLQLIFSRAKIEGRIIRKIDLRFDKPVVSYE